MSFLPLARHHRNAEVRPKFSANAGDSVGPVRPCGRGLAPRIGNVGGSDPLFDLLSSRPSKCFSYPLQAKTANEASLDSSAGVQPGSEPRCFADPQLGRSLVLKR